MKFLIATDLHGSLFYTNKVIEAYKLHQADQLLLLGDLLNHGPRNPLPLEYNPSACATLLNEYKNDIIAVRGNCDSEVDQLLFAFDMLDSNTSVYLNKRRIFLTHGHNYNHENIPNLKPNDLLIFGHTHLRLFDKVNDIYVFNPGSITLPKTLDKLHTYAILEANQISVYNDNHEVIEIHNLK